MDANQALVLLDGLPFGSDIAIDVFHDALREYLSANEQHDAQKAELQERRKQAILTAPLGRHAVPSILSGWAWISGSMDWSPPEKRFLQDDRDAWVFDSEAIEIGRCQSSRLSLGIAGVDPRNQSEWDVWAWIPRELSRDAAYRKFPEPLPLPEDNDYTDCSLGEREWLVIFAAMFELNPESRKQSLVPPLPDEPLQYADLRESGRNIHQRTPIKSLMDSLKSVTSDQIPRFISGRETVVRTLLNECRRRVFPKPQDESVGFDEVTLDDASEKLPRPEWLSATWKTSFRPTTNSLDSIRRWLGFAIQGLDRWRASFQSPARWDDVVSAGLAQQISRDAVWLARYARDDHNVLSVPSRPKDESLTEVIAYLDDLECAITATLLEPLPKGTTDSLAFIAAKTPAAGHGGIVDSTKTNESALVELSVDLPSRRATLRTAKGDESFDLPSEGVARWLKVLAEHPGQWIRPDDYKTHDAELDGVKPSDKLRSLTDNRKCQRLAKLIESSKHDGMRFDPARL